MIVTNYNQGIDCCIIDTGVGTAEPGDNPSRQQAALERKYGPLSAIAQHGVHPGGHHCQTVKLIGWEALAVIVGMAAVLSDRWPVHIQDQYRARVAEVTREGQQEFS